MFNWFVNTSLVLDRPTKFFLETEQTGLQISLRALNNFKKRQKVQYCMMNLIHKHPNFKGKPFIQYKIYAIILNKKMFEKSIRS